MIKIEKLTKEFITESGSVTALDSVDIEISKGDIFGIIGMSGAGKSTLLRCISLLEKPTSGQIIIDSVNTARLSSNDLRSLRKEIGIIFQGYQLFMQKSVSQNIAFPLEISDLPKTEIKQRVIELLELVGLSDKAYAYPAQLSGGQKQRVAIARALANNSKILLCDEPTSALDALTTNSILQLLLMLNKKLGVTILIITHDISVVSKVCNRMAIIDNSRVVEQGETSRLLKDSNDPIIKTLFSIEGELE